MTRRRRRGLNDAEWPKKRGRLGRYHGLDAVLPLIEVGVELPLAEIYEGVKINPEEAEDSPAR